MVEKLSIVVLAELLAAGLVKSMTREVIESF